MSLPPGVVDEIEELSGVLSAAATGVLALDVTDVFSADTTDVFSAGPRLPMSILVEQESHLSKVRPVFKSKANVH